MVREATPATLIEKAYGDAMITLPMAPSAGLYLDKASFDRYVNRAQWNAPVSLDWEKHADIAEKIAKFREEAIVGHITSQVRGEKIC